MLRPQTRTGDLESVVKFMAPKKFRFFRLLADSIHSPHRKARSQYEVRLENSVPHLSSSHRRRSSAASRTIFTLTLTHGEKRQSNQSRFFTRPKSEKKNEKEECLKGRETPSLSLLSLSLYLNNRFCHLDRTRRCSEKSNSGMYGP